MTWHLAHIHKVMEEMQSGEAGLSAQEAGRRLREHGLNELLEQNVRTPLRILWEQFTATMVLILLGAAVAAAFLGDAKNAIAILAIVIVYAALGFIQEFRAEKAVAALKRMAVPTVRVMRDGALRELPARELVPGDLVVLETGNVVPADGRLAVSINLKIRESALTGESEDVEKQTAPLMGDSLPLGDRRNMAFLGTTVTRGRGTMIVTATGMKTELGKIAVLLQQTGVEQTPLQRRLDRMGKVLATAGIVIALIIFVLGIIQGNDLRHMLLVAVSVAVAVVPEGLPAVVTITLALGSQRMLRRNALIRRLSAVETLGSVTVICSDKTGTLTENRMTAVYLDALGHVLDLTRRESIPKNSDGNTAETAFSLLVLGAALCNDANAVSNGDDDVTAIGDPTEGALVVLAARRGMRKNVMEGFLPRTGEIPFDSARKRMTTFHLLSNAGSLVRGVETTDMKVISFTKGSVDGLLPVCSHARVNGVMTPLSPEVRNRIEEANDLLASKGMRVLGVSCRLFRENPVEPSSELEREQTFLGLIGMIDPPRTEVRDAVALTKRAGIRTVMITGDHPLTAEEIARQLGIQDTGRILTGADLDVMTAQELKQVVDEVVVFARVSPEHKLKIVEALQARGHIVSMTGDGVNDAPALHKADIGVAMGITGTDVTKEASDLVLLDDNFATIVAAVSEGRTIYDNIRKFVRFSVAGNIGKILVMLLAPMLGKPIPLLPLQLLWLNLLTDGLLGVGLGVEPAEKAVMARPPHPPHEGIFARGMGRETVLIGSLIGFVTLGVGAWYYFGGHSNWRTVIFTSLAFAQTGQVLAVRSGQDTVQAGGLLSNPLMLMMICTVVFLQIMVVYLPPLQSFFSTQHLDLTDLIVTAGVGVVVFSFIEGAKIVGTKSTRKERP